MVSKCIKEFLDKILVHKTVVSVVPKKELVIALTDLGKLSLQVRTRINRKRKNKLPYFQLTVNSQLLLDNACCISRNVGRAEINWLRRITLFIEYFCGR